MPMTVLFLNKFMGVSSFYTQARLLRFVFLTALGTSTAAAAAGMAMHRRAINFFLFTRIFLIK
ncbi:MAG: hypothetical protein RR336_06360, partial [Oscillospiraceae bacterium]